MTDRKEVTEWNTVSQRYKKEFVEFPRDKSCTKGNTSFK